VVYIEFFDSWEDALEAERKAREKADSRVRPAQGEIKPGQYFINCRHCPDLPIFGEILDYRKLGIDAEEQEYINETYEQLHMRFYRPTKAYSAACFWGELGDIHLSEISAIIDPELFRWYKDNAWMKPSR
jgi:hypothetical protein